MEVHYFRSHQKPSYADISFGVSTSSILMALAASHSYVLILFRKFILLASRSQLFLKKQSDESAARS